MTEALLPGHTATTRRFCAVVVHASAGLEVAVTQVACALLIAKAT
jgi:hypothetical protein